MYHNMDHLDLDLVNRSYFFDTHNHPLLITNSDNSSGGGTHNNNGGSSITGSSSNSSDLFLYDENSSSDSVLSEYSNNSDQENYSSTKDRNCRHHHHHHNNHSYRRRSGGTSKCPQQQIQQRQAANLRERKRMQSINDAFEGLRAHIPTLPYEKRLSKVDTLKLAIGYIHFLSDLVRTDRNCNNGNSTDCYGGATNTGNGHNRNLTQKNQPQKIIVRGSGGGLYTAHSLSWSRTKETLINGRMHAKIWIPEDPRGLNPDLQTR